MLQTLSSRVVDDSIVELLWNPKTDESEIIIVNENGQYKIHCKSRYDAAELYRHPWLIDLRMDLTTERSGGTI